MNLIEKLGIEKCKQILSEAPDGATLFYRFSKEHEFRVDYYKHFFNYFQMWLIDHGWFPVHSDLAEDALSVEELRQAIDHHYYGQSEEKELEQYAELSQEKIEGGAVLIGDFSKAKKIINALIESDDVSDIRNHISPLMKVIER